MLIFIMILIVVIAIIIPNLYDSYKRRNYKKTVIELADKGVVEYQNKLSEFLANGMTSKEYNELRREIYLPKAEKGDAFAEYYIGLNVDDKESRLKWWTKSAEHGYVEAMQGLALGYSEFSNENEGPFAFGYNQVLLAYQSCDS